ncbi:hypothetical protein [Pseudalkalibacillus decolorationis]|uniref:hypothetical protein n=1 Tax=Pseudalkalibacillus decolorationis TaxID=163879 RepID=UPI00214950E1|nr:hypothetical protein [Pseudalkalibacillus decolorationis]
MAQLLKLEDCISRYEADVFRYTGQYTRLKRDRWERVKTNWEDRINSTVSSRDPQEPVDDKKWWRKRSEQPEILLENFYIKADISSIEELKTQFMDEIFRFQLKWASSTLTEKSRLSHSTPSDSCLKFLLTELPDNYLLLYKPILQMKNAATQLDVILIGPDSVHCLVFIDISTDTIVTGTKGRFWSSVEAKQSQQMISPVPAIQRMNYFLDRCVNLTLLDLKVHYTLVAKEGIINNDTTPSYIKIIDQRTFKDWHLRLKRQPSPIKFKQLKAAKAIIEHGVSSSYKRPEWDSKNNWD